MAFEKLKNNLNNKENLLKIFDRESYDYFINEKCFKAKKMNEIFIIIEHIFKQDNKKKKFRKL